MQQRQTATCVYHLDRRKQKTMSLRVKEDGTVLVRAPLRMPLGEIDRFVENHRKWIQTQQRAMEMRRQENPEITEKERMEGKSLARMVIGQKCQEYAARMGVSYGMISIREQKTRWGSCSSKGNLNFNWKLVRMPEQILDYVVVHELAHRIEMNHSAAFWAIVEQHIPDYRERRMWLKKNGHRY